MKVVGRRGRSQYLLAVSRQSRVGRILDLDDKLLYPETNVQAIIKRGYWEEYSLPKEALDEILATVTKVPVAEGVGRHFARTLKRRSARVYRRR